MRLAMTINCHPELRERAEALSENHAFRGAVFRESSKTDSGSGQCWIPARNVGQIPKQVRNDNMDSSCSNRSEPKLHSLNSRSSRFVDAAQRSAQPSPLCFSWSSRPEPKLLSLNFHSGRFVDAAQRPAQGSPPPDKMLTLCFFIFLSFPASRLYLILNATV